MVSTKIHKKDTVRNYCGKFCTVFIMGSLYLDAVCHLVAKTLDLLLGLISQDVKGKIDKKACLALNRHTVLAYKRQIMTKW